MQHVLVVDPVPAANGVSRDAGSSNGLPNACRGELTEVGERAEVTQLVGAEHRGQRLDLAALSDVERDNADQPFGRVEHRRPGLPVDGDLTQREGAEVGRGGPHRREQRAGNPHPADDRLRQAAVQGHIVGQQLLEPAEVAVSGGGEEPTGQALASLARRLKAGPRRAMCRRARATSWRAFSSLVSTIVAIWS